MARHSRKRPAEDHNNNKLKRTRLDGARVDHYSPPNSTRRGRSSPPRRQFPPPHSHHSSHERRRRSPSLPNPRQYPLRSAAPRAIERPEDHTLAVRETPLARDRGQNFIRPIRQIKEEGPETSLEETTWDAYYGTGMLSLEQQLPQLRSSNEFYPLDLYSPPQLLATIEPSTHSWRTAFLEVRQFHILSTLQSLKLWYRESSFTWTPQLISDSWACTMSSLSDSFGNRR